METFTENVLGRNFALYFTAYLSIALSNILSHSKTIKNAKKLSVFGKSDSRCLSHFLQTRIFWKFDHISRTSNQINYRNIWFAKLIIILIVMAQVLFFGVFSEEDPHLNAVEFRYDFVARLRLFVLTSKSRCIHPYLLWTISCWGNCILCRLVIEFKSEF